MKSNQDAQRATGLRHDLQSIASERKYLVDEFRLQLWTAEQVKEKGNAAFKAKEYGLAIELYKEAMGAFTIQR